MKGLYVYGALLMGLSFAAGQYLSSNLVMASAIASCALAALSEAVAEINEAKSKDFGKMEDAIAVASWVLTAVTVSLAISQLMLGKIL